MEFYGCWLSGLSCDQPCLLWFASFGRTWKSTYSDHHSSCCRLGNRVTISVRSGLPAKPWHYAGLQIL